MAKHWRIEDDLFLVSHFETMGDFIGEHDLGRPKGAATRRVAHLKKTGAWDALCRHMKAQNRGNIAAYRAELEYAIALNFDVEIAPLTDDEADCPAALWDGCPAWRQDPYGEEEEDRQLADMEMHQDMLVVLREAEAQISYLHDKFQTTGSGEAVLSHLRAIIARAA